MKFNIEEFKAKTREVVNNNLGKGNTALAKLILKDSEYADSHNAIEYLRNWIAKNKEELINAPDEDIPDYIKDKIGNINLHSWSEWDMTNYTPPIIPSTTVPPFEGEIVGFNKAEVNKEKSDRVLLVPDLHLPFADNIDLQHCINVYNEYKCNKVIFIGDIVDNHYESFHTPSQNGTGQKFENDLVHTKIQQWNKAFPKAVWILGNHDMLPFRKGKEGMISNQWFKTFNEVYGVNWEVVTDYEMQGIYFNHGETMTAKTMASKTGRCVVQGHRHGECYIQHLSPSLWAVQLGICFNPKTYAFEYAKEATQTWTRGCGVLINGTPIFLPNKLK